MTATALPGQPGRVIIERITGDGGRLPLEASQNCVGIAALEALEMIKASHGTPTCGVSLVLEKVRPPPGCSLLSNRYVYTIAIAVIYSNTSCSLIYRGIEYMVQREKTCSAWHTHQAVPGMMEDMTCQSMAACGAASRMSC